MRDHTVRCAGCQRAAGYPAYRCGRCGAPLVLELAAVTVAQCRPTAGTGIWRYAGLLPRTASTVTLGEGATPLLPLRHDPAEASGAVKASGAAEVFAKLESLNPSLSFKDRAMALAVATARDAALVGLVLASTGNAAVSAATYAAAAGLRCRVFCATGSRASTKLDTARAHGAEIELVAGDYSDAYAAATGAQGQGWLNVTTTYRNPLLTEAYRPVAAELVEQLGGVPDAVVVPVGAGPLLRGIWLGFTDLRAAGVTMALPRMVGVQAAACAPLARAFAASGGSVSDRASDGSASDGSTSGWEASLRTPLVATPTAATAIADALRGYESEGLLTLAAARDSGGAIVAVDEPAIADAGRRLARQGLFVEPAAAAAQAALATTALAASGRVVIVLTGHGAKEPAALGTFLPAGSVA